MCLYRDINQQTSIFDLILQLSDDLKKKKNQLLIVFIHNPNTIDTTHP